MWDLRPTPIAPDKAWPHWLDLKITWGEALEKRSNEYPEKLQRATFNLLTAVAAGQDWRAPLLADLQKHMTDGRLMVARTVDAFTDVFLAGGFRDAYPVALAVADTGAGVGRKPAGLHLLLRMLAQYAVEIPPDVAIELPANISALAVANGRTSAQEEARRLGIALARAEDGAAWLADLREGRASTTPREARGLWTDPVLRPLPEDVRLEDGRIAQARDLAHLRGIVADPSYLAVGTHVQCFSEAWVNEQRAYFVPVPAPDDELRVLAVITAAASHGSDAVRREMRRPVTKAAGQGYPHEFAGGRKAVQQWAASDFTVDDYWRTAWRSVSVSVWTVRSEFPDQDHEQLHHSRRGSASVRYQDFDIARDDHDAAPPGAAARRHAGRGLAARATNRQPAGRRPATARRVSRAGRAGGNRPVPTARGTPERRAQRRHPRRADLGRLHPRLRRPAGPPRGVRGPTGRAARPGAGPAPAAARGPRTAGRARRAQRPDDARAHLSRRHESWDVVELVRIVGIERGTPASRRARRRRQVDLHGYRTRAVHEVPSARTRPSVAETPYGSAADLARVFPTWSDRAVRNAFVEGSRHGTTTADFPAHATGSFGAPLHDLFLHDLTRATVNPDRIDDRLLGARCALGHQRFDPALFAEVGLQRHRAGTLDLPHLLETTQALGEQQLVKQLWPLLTALASGLAAEPKRPPALAGMFRQLSGWVVEIPERVELPDGIRHLADARGSSKAHEAARTLVEAVEQA